ncbi:MAG: precorrin-6y C5,15-methyltransferase (decarboxylating) subunit CbiE [Arenicellales bacterium WSBS_2016_MAG_OTU3]
MKPWLTVIGVGVNGLSGLPGATTSLLQNAEIVAGGTRQLDMLGNDNRPSLNLSDGFAQKLEALLALRGTPTCVLASGDPMCFGIGATLTRHLEANEMLILPQPSAFSLASAKLCWPQQTLTTLSLHGRPVEILNAHLYPGNRILALTSNSQTLLSVISLLRKNGFAQSRLTALCNLGADNEQILCATAKDWKHNKLPDLYTLAIECIAEDNAVVLSSAPGLNDDVYEHDGQLTKREVRAVTIAMLKPQPGALLWDLGAGCGSISIEWMRAAKDASAIAIERDRQRADMIARNALALGTPGLQIICEDHENEIPNHPPDNLSPDAIFIGGGLKNPETLENAYLTLEPRGRLVANAVTIDTENLLIQFQQKRGGSLIKLEISRVGPIGQQQGWQAARPVTQLVIEKT